MTHQCGSCSDAGCVGLCKATASDPREWTMGEADAYDEGFCAGAAATRDEMRAENARHMARLAAALAERDRLRAVLSEMVAMMDSGDEHGAGSDWHRAARAALDASHD